MPRLTQAIDTFPSVHIPSESGGLPIDVSLIAQLGHGAGSHLLSRAAEFQRRHRNFRDELDEPSVKLGNSNFANGDATALYSFVVGPKGHPFHRHAGQRVFTAISGSGGAQLRFSTASMQQIESDPRNFLRALHYINIPPDCLFTVRFGGETWHQFVPLTRSGHHPALFALSCHPDELGGELSPALKKEIRAGKASIPSLTELLPEDVGKLFGDNGPATDEVSTTTLSLYAPEGTPRRAICNGLRSFAGSTRAALSHARKASGFLSSTGPLSNIEPLPQLPADSLLRRHLAYLPPHYEDSFRLVIHSDRDILGAGAASLLSAVLDGFLHNAPRGVTNLMAARNVMVKPFGLRTSPLGCPASSLLSRDDESIFADKHPVLDQETTHDDNLAQVILGADDKHLSFRSCVSVRTLDTHRAEVILGTRVRCTNLFGKAYMAAIDPVHRKYIAPAMLRHAVDYALSHGQFLAGSDRGLD